MKEKIQAYESTSSPFISKEISNIDSLAYALGSQEHCRRAKGLSLGPCPSKMFDSNAYSYNGSFNFSFLHTIKKSSS